MRAPTWDARDLERFVRHLRQPRAELEKLDHQLRRAGWTDAELEDLELARALLGQVQGLLLQTARRLRHQPPPPAGRCLLMLLDIVLSPEQGTVVFLIIFLGLLFVPFVGGGGKR